MALVLASASPRRAELLRKLGVDFTVVASDVPEVPTPGEDAEDFARRAAREKGTAVARTCAGRAVLAADTIVVIDGTVLGKPADAADARHMLQSLSGRDHLVLTAVVLVDRRGAVVEEFVVRSRVTFRMLAAEEIAAYVASGEPADKAGAYAIQGGAAPFVRSVAGSYTNVIGLPIDEVRELLRRYGLLEAENG